MGGLNLPSTKMLSLPCFLSSANAASKMVSTLYPERVASIEGIDAALALWEAQTGAAAINTPSSKSQRKLFEASAARLYKELAESTPDSPNAVRLKCLSCTEAGAYLSGPPSQKHRTRLDGPAFACAVRLRQGQPVAAASRCVCGQDLDPLGSHALNCRHGNGKQVRHRLINEFVRSAFVSAGCAVVLEPQGLSRTDGKRPGVTVLPFSNGRCLSWDATCWNPLAPSHFATAVRKNGAVAENAEAQKRAKYEGSLENVDFVPLAVESTGAVGPSFLKLLSKLSARIADRGVREGAHSRLLRELSAAV